VQPRRCVPSYCDVLLFRNSAATIATRMVAMMICRMNVSQKLEPQPMTLANPRPAAAPMIPMKTVMMQPTGCIVGTRRRAMSPMQMPASRPLMMPEGSMRQPNHLMPGPCKHSRRKTATIRP
jgi:hypothetical protein